MNKCVAGKKGSRSKSHYRPSNASDSTANAIQSEESFNNATYVYNEIYNNDHPFVSCMLPSDAKTCKGCENDFCHGQKIIPFDLVFSHKERYHFRLHRDWKNEQASNRESTRYYHADPKCIMPRFSYFSNDFIEIPGEVRNSLQESHKVYLENLPLLSI